MSGTEEPHYVRRRNDREQKAKERERSERNTQQRDDNTAVFDAIIEEIRGYRSEQDENEPKKLTTDRIAATAAVIAAILSLGSLIAFVCLTLKTDQTARKAVGVASGQLSEMQADQRAWMKVEVVAPQDYSKRPVRISDGLSYWPGVKDVASIPIHIAVRNVGKGPAFNVRAGIWPIFGYQDKIVDLMGWERKNCASLDSYPAKPELVANGAIAQTLFPNDPFSFDESGVFLGPDAIKKHAYISGKERVIQIWFYGCVRYQLSGSSQQHQTGFVYGVSRLIDAGIPGGKAQDGTFPVGLDVPASRLLLTAKPMAVGVAD